MRLHRLRVRAFGPFAGDVEVDLDALGANGLFLIHGPTGSGKTSLLDAVCYALYGTVPGVRQEAKALRSHHADPTASPLVELELTAGGRRLLVERTPEYRRPKKRGEGSTLVQSSVVLRERVDGEWVARGTRHADVGDVVKDVIGLDARQFQTVVLLPQGEFSTFLRADTPTRVDVLSRLFDTSRFDDITTWLEQRRRTTEAAVRERRAELRLALTRAGDALAAVPADLPAVAFEQVALDLFATGTDGSTAPTTQGAGGAPVALVRAAPEVDVEATEPHAVRTTLAAATDFVEARARGTRERRGLTSASLATARRARSEGESLARMRENAARAQRELAELDAAVPEIDAARDRLHLAVRAGATAGHLAALDAAAAGAVRSRGAVDDLPEQLRDTVGATTTFQTLAARDADLPRLVDLAARDTSAQQDLSARLTAARRAEADLVRAQEQSEQLRSARAEAVEARTGLAAQAAAEGALRTVVDQLRAVAEGHTALAHAEVTLAGATEDATAARAARDAAQRTASELLRARADGLAAELAGTLADGHPCPVCGSPEHPAPAEPGPAGRVSAEDVAQAETELAACRTRAGAADATVAAETARRDERRSELHRLVHRLAAPTAGPAALPLDADDLLDSTGVQNVLSEAGRLLTEARDAGRALLRLDADLARVDEQILVTESALVTRRESVAATAADVTTARSAAEQRRAELVALLQDHSSCSCTAPDRRSPARAFADDGVDGGSPTAVDDRRALVDAVVRAHERAGREAAAAVEAHRAAERAGAAHQEAEQRLADALAEAELPDAEAARAALLPEPERDRLASLVAGHERARTSVEAILHQEEVIAAVAATEPDLDALSGAEARATAAADAAVADDTLVREALARLAAARTAADAVLDDLAPALREAEAVREVADTAAGTGPNNALRMSLTTFVLAARLEEVVRLANERLAVMTSGRYELRHTDALATRGRRSGLGLEVLDAWSGTARDTTTLSGGETFMASLALALGLGDAVRAETGGLDLETLFVDEGFGTLDDEALEHVMDVLDGLRAGGRSVGIVSHVAELRTRIPAQVRLRRTTTGSSVDVLAAPEPV